jgi:hypothetical protein
LASISSGFRVARIGLPCLYDRTPLNYQPTPAPLVNHEPRTTRQIPRSHHARIRTWVNYGLTIPQVAEVYGVAVGVIERILREA